MPCRESKRKGESGWWDAYYQIEILFGAGRLKKGGGEPPGKTNCKIICYKEHRHLSSGKVRTGSKISRLRKVDNPQQEGQHWKKGKKTFNFQAWG